MQGLHRSEWERTHRCACDPCLALGTSCCCSVCRGEVCAGTLGANCSVHGVLLMRPRRSHQSTCQLCTRCRLAASHRCDSRAAVTTVSIALPTLTSSPTQPSSWLCFWQGLVLEVLRQPGVDVTDVADLVRRLALKIQEREAAELNAAMDASKNL